MICCLTQSKSFLLNAQNCHFYFFISYASVAHEELSTVCSLPSTQLLIVFSLPFTVMSLNVWLQLCQPPFRSLSVLAVLVQDINAVCAWQGCAAQRKQQKRQHWRNKTSQEHLQQSLSPSHDAKQLWQIKTMNCILDSCKFTTAGMRRRAKKTPFYRQQSLWYMSYSTS